MLKYKINIKPKIDSVRILTLGIKIMIITSNINHESSNWCSILNTHDNNKEWNNMSIYLYWSIIFRKGTIKYKIGLNPQS